MARAGEEEAVVDRRAFLERLALQLPPKRWPPAAICRKLEGQPLKVQFNRTALAALMESFRVVAGRVVETQQLDLRDYAVVVALVPRDQAAEE